MYHLLTLSTGYFETLTHGLFVWVTFSHVIFTLLFTTLTTDTYSKGHLSDVSVLITFFSLEEQKRATTFFKLPPKLIS